VGPTGPYCRTARLLAACCAASRQLPRALGYLDAADAHEPGTARTLLLRLRLLLERAGSAVQGGAPHIGGSGSGREGEAAEANAGALAVLQKLPHCFDFEPSHLTVRRQARLYADARVIPTPLRHTC
jgi:hypothetical protein